MHRIDASDHVANLFDEGDPGVPRLPTQVDSEWLNAVQEELANFIEAAGVTLVKNTNTQLVSALGTDLANGTLFCGRAANSGASGGFQRVIFKDDGAGETELQLTVNASWDAVAGEWNKDVPGSRAARVVLHSSRFAAIESIAAATASPFDESDWAVSTNAGLPALSREATVAPTLLNSWANLGGSFAVSGYSVLPDGTVRLQGAVTGGTTGTAIFNLPFTMRPSAGGGGGIRVFSVAGSGAAGISVSIDTAGDVKANFSGGGTRDVYLDGITFGYE